MERKFNVGDLVYDKVSCSSVTIQDWVMQPESIRYRFMAKGELVWRHQEYLEKIEAWTNIDLQVSIYGSLQIDLNASLIEYQNINKGSGLYFDRYFISMINFLEAIMIGSVKIVSMRYSYPCIVTVCSKYPDLEKYFTKIHNQLIKELPRKD